MTGISGFAGSHLAEALLHEGAEVHGLVHEGPPRPNLRAIEADLALHSANLLDLDGTRRAVRDARPEVVFHLAAQPVPAQSWRDPRATVEVNVLGTLDLLEALRDLASGPLLVLASSAEVYAPDEGEAPLREDHPLGPDNPYAASKVAQETLVDQYARAGVIRCVILRAANQLGPRLHPELVASAFARQIVRAEGGGERVVRVGNLSARRDFVDVRDMARAYVLAAERAEPGHAYDSEAGDARPKSARVYNVGTGSAVPIRTILDLLVAESRVPVEVREDPARRRPDDRPALALDASAFRERTSWAPAIPLRRSVRDTLEHWRLAAAVHAPQAS